MEQIVCGIDFIKKKKKRFQIINTENISMNNSIFFDKKEIRGLINGQQRDIQSESRILDSISF